MMMRTSKMATMTTTLSWRRSTAQGIISRLCLCVLLLCGTVSVVTGQSSNGSPNKNKINIQDLQYRVFPKRTVQEAAVLEWGHSAIITALDASVAHFGPQTTDAALLEVETRPILAKPLNGIHAVDRQQAMQQHRDDNNNPETTPSPLPVKPLENANEVVGSMVIMTNEGGLTGLQLARVAQMSGAAALLVVNYDSERPDDIYRLPVDDKDKGDDIEIPVVMISLNSANLLASAMYDHESSSRSSPPSRLTNKYLPERVRLYAGDDRPFFEDVESAYPTVYLIHDLLTAAECDALVARAQPILSPMGGGEDDVLQHSMAVAQHVNVERVTLWQGMLQFPAQKTVEERIEQVTAFPSAHFSDFVVDHFRSGSSGSNNKKGPSYAQPKYDILGDRMVPVASITVFLTDALPGGGGEIVYPSPNTGDPIKVLPRKGLAVVHHNTDERGQFDVASQHAVLPVQGGEEREEYLYLAHKYIYMDPISYARRVALPAVALTVGGGTLPRPVVQFYQYMVQQFGPDKGDEYFDKVLIFIPILILALIAQMVANHVRGKVSASSSSSSSSTTSTKDDKKGGKKD